MSFGRGRSVGIWKKTAKLIKTNRSQNSCRTSPRQDLANVTRKFFQKLKLKHLVGRWELRWGVGRWELRINFLFSSYVFCFYYYFIPPLGFGVIFRRSGNAPRGRRQRAALSRTRPQFFTIRSSQPANNIYIFTTRDKIWILVKGKILYFTVYIINWFIYRGSNTSHLSRTRKRNSKSNVSNCFHTVLERHVFLLALRTTSCRNYIFLMFY